MRNSILFIAAMFAFGCSPPPSYYDDLPDAGADVSVDPPDVDNTGTQVGQSYSTKLTRLQFTGPPVADLNGIVAVNMPETLDKPIVILHTLSDFNAEAGSARFTARPGLKGDGADEFQVDPDFSAQGADATFDLATGRFSATLPRFNFVSWIEFQGETQRINFPVTDLEITGVLQIVNDTEATIPSGEWEGYVTKTDGDATLVKLVGASQPQPLTDLFSEQSLNFDTVSQTMVEPGSGDAWHIHANFVARSITIAN